MIFPKSLWRRALPVLLAGLWAMPLAHAAETQSVQSFERTLTKTVGYKYLLAFPTGYEAKGEKRWPLMIFLHGAGERGDDVWTVAKHGPPKLIKEAGDDAATRLLTENFIVVSPQCPKGKWWDAEAVLALLDEILSRHLVDTSRVYLTGLSMGGFGTWDVAMAYPEKFAAIAPICGGGQFATAFQSNLSKRSELRSLGVWVFHGGQDKTVSPAESQHMVDLLKRFEVTDLTYTVYPEAPHDSWTQTYSNPELYTWLLKHERKPAAN